MPCFVCEGFVFTWQVISITGSHRCMRGLCLPVQVINLTMPSSIERYIHRVGRTARAGKSGRYRHKSCVLVQSFTTSNMYLSLCLCSVVLRFYARQHICYIARICYRLSICLSVRPSVTRVDQSKTVEARITKFSPYSSPIPLVFQEQAFHLEILRDSPEWGR